MDLNDPRKVVDGTGLAPIQRRTFLKGMAGMAGAVMLGACSSTRTGGGTGGVTLKLKSWADLGYPSPYTYTAGPGYWRTSLLFDTLTWPDETGKQIPWLASSYEESEDGLSYTVELRDAKWSDGRPVTADDVVFTYEYFQGKTFTPLLVSVPRHPESIADVIARDDRTVEFRLSQPDATFLQFVLGTMLITPRHIFSTVTDPMSTFDQRVLIGTGAYKLEMRDMNQGNELYVARPDYFLGNPYVQRIEQIYFDDAAALNALSQGQLDGTATSVEGVTNDALDPFRNDPKYTVIDQQGAWGWPLFFNIQRGGALADVRFRRACLHAINAPDLVDRLLTGNGGVGSQGFLSPENPYYKPVREYPFDPAQAERLLDEAGFTRLSPGGPRRNSDGSPIKYTLFMVDLVPIALTELIQANLKEVGIEIDLRRIDLVRLFGTKNEAAYDMLITSYPGPSGIGPNGDPEQLRNIYHSKPPNTFQKATGYSNPEMDRLIDAQQRAVTFEERKALVGQIQEIAAEDLPVAMLYYTTMFFVYEKSVFDAWYYTPMGFGPSITEVFNKQAYITGRKTGTKIA
jgi:peptide/nickel transport system substrate-binding protein